MDNPIKALNKHFESRVRLGVMSILAASEWVDFNSLKEFLEITDGNLASHIKALETHKYIDVRKQFVGRKPKTSYTLTDLGKVAFKNHITALESLLNT